jgi:hypothetical protein
LKDWNAMTEEQAWIVLDAVLDNPTSVTNGQVLDAVAALHACRAQPVQPSESERFTTLVSLLSALTSALVGQTLAINRMLDADDVMAIDEPQTLNPRRA